ncbi:MAG: acyl carrier protein [Phycisphaerae bacterium]|nr:acyl carrier protein [Phycisphaerae bacterium]
MEKADTLQNDVRQIIADILAIDAEEVVPTARFVEDLGAESIDMLELSFRCEKRFGIKDPFGELGKPGDLATDESGRLTPDSLATLKVRFPFLDYTRFSDDPRKSRLTELLTVEAITGLVAQAVRPACG